MAMPKSAIFILFSASSSRFRVLMSRCKTPLLCMCCNPSTVYIQHSVVRAQLGICELCNQANSLHESQLLHLYGQFPTCVFWQLSFILADEVKDRAFAGKLCDNIYVTLFRQHSKLPQITDSRPEQVCLQQQHLIKEGVEIFNDVGRVQV